MAIYEQIVDKLMLQLDRDGRVKDLSNEFNHLNENYKKVKFAEKILLESKIESTAPIHIPKNSERSKEVRQQGNQFFSLKNKNYVRALQLYNESICFAENNSEDLAIGYANRSAIYFEWKMYDLCLENIELAKKTGYPERLMDKLNKRETECKKSLEAQSNDEDEDILVPKLSHPPHPEIPFIADCLELKENPDVGRYITTNKDLKVGQVIALEDDFCSIILPRVRYQRCVHCLQENNYCLMPCSGCSSTMFCSEECAKLANESFHKYECPIIDFMFHMFNVIQLSAVRVAICALTSFDSPQDLLNFVQEPNIEKINAFTIEYTENTPKRELYKPIHTLETNQSKRATAELFQRATITAVAYKKLLENSKLNELLKSDEEINLLIELIFRHLQTASTNFHRLETLPNTLNVNHIDDVSYGSGAYSFCSLINHACSPNIVRLPVQKRIAIFVLRPIKAGEELLDNYG